MSKPTSSIFPIQNGKLINNLDANDFQISNLDTSNLSISGGGGDGGNDTGTTTAILKGDGNHGFADAISDVDYASVTALGLKEDSSSHNADIVLLQSSITTLTASVATKASSASVTAGLALKTDLTAFNAYVTSNDAAVALKANSSDMTSALALKADASALTSGLAGKENTLPTTLNDAWILARRSISGGNQWFFVDPLTLGTTSQTFADGVENSTTTFTSATANFVANDVGKAIVGTNIPGGTTIASRTNSTTVVLSAAATATASGITFTIVNRVEIGGTGTVGSVSVNNDPGNVLFATAVSNPTTSPTIGITMAGAVAANTFYGNSSAFAGSASFMSAAFARTALGGSTVGQAMFQLANPSLVSWARINADNSVTTRTAAQTLSDLGAENALSFSAPLTRTTNTVSMPAATDAVPGFLTAADHASFNAKVPGSYVINTTAPLRIDGGASAALTGTSRTFSIPKATAAVDGYLGATDFSTFATAVPSNRTIGTTAPLTIGGVSGGTLDLSANRTIGIPKATASVDGYLAASDFSLFQAGGPRTTQVTQTSGSLTLTAGTPPVNRIVFTAQLVSPGLTIFLPPANAYTAALGYPFLEFVDLVQGGVMANASLILRPSGSDSLDGTNQITIPRGMAYLRLNSDSINRWTSTKYFVDSFKDATDPRKLVVPDLSQQSWAGGVPPLTPYKFIPALDRDGYSIGTLTPVDGQFVNGQLNGVLQTTALKPTDAVPRVATLTTTADDSVSPNDGTIDTVKLAGAPMAAVHLYTWPDVALYSPGETVRFIDSTGSVSSLFFARVKTSSTYTVGNTFNGQQTIDITEANFNRVFVADPANHNWIVSTFGGTNSSGLSLDIWHAVDASSGTATIICSGNVVENHHIVTMTGAIVVVMVNATNGQTGRIRFSDTNGGNHVVTVPNNIGATPAAEGVGVFTTSTGSPGVEDEWGWSYNGAKFFFYPLGKKMVAAAAPSFVTPADDSSGLTSNSNNNQGDSFQWQYGIATQLNADGGTTTGAAYTVGKIRLFLAKIGSPTQNLNVAIRSDNGAEFPTNTVIGTTGPAVAASTLNPTTEAAVDFSPNANLIGKRNISVTTTATSQAITSPTAAFLPSDLGCRITGTGIPAGSQIASFTDASNASLDVAATGSGTITASIQHIYWIVLYGDNTTFDAVNYVTWFGHAPVTGSDLCRSQNGTTWVKAVPNKSMKFTTFK